MGDGRYYTPEQFFTIILFTTLIIFMVIGFMLCLYKVDRYKKWIRAIGSILGISLVFSFIAEIAYTQSNIYNILSKVLLMLYILVCFVFYIRHFMQDGNNKRLKIIAFLLFCTSAIIYTINPALQNLIYILFVMNFIFLSNRFVKYRVSASVFSDVKKLLLDYVFITGINGDVIFRSDKVANSTIFKNERKIDVENIEKLFFDQSIIRSAFDKQFLKLDSDEIYYFQYHKKEIFDKEKLAGYILTFTDITDLIAMLDKLSNKQEKVSKINAELIKYKEIVYDIEKEKEINNLLDEIANNQQKAMLELKHGIEQLNINDKRVIKHIEKLISTAKADLKDIRGAVTAYINYYEEGGYDD